VQCGHKKLVAMHTGEQLQLSQECALHILEVEQNLRMGAGLLQRYESFAMEHAREPEDGDNEAG